MEPILGPLMSMARPALCQSAWPSVMTVRVALDRMALGNLPRTASHMDCCSLVVIPGWLMLPSWTLPPFSKPGSAPLLFR